MDIQDTVMRLLGTIGIMAAQNVRTDLHSNQGDIRSTQQLEIRVIAFIKASISNLIQLHEKVSLT